ncbi:molybdate ABC transporter permease subunit [Thiobacter aerophilum]|uniref:Molybdenum transport system permease n=1 Tax=Thiobacter aerophilum TaxID=3121275 RepID=A0ABV0ECN9_9BURK
MELFGHAIDLGPLWLTLEVASISTAILLVPGIAIAWVLAHWKSPLRAAVEAVVALPLVLPPVVLGFYLLVFLNPQGWLTQTLHSLGYEGQLTFNKIGLIIGSVVYSLPFMVQPLLRAFEALPQNLLDAAATLRAGWWDRFFNVVLPLSRGGLIVALTLTFAHTVGEFGVVLMVGGNIPGKTRMVSIDIYNHVEAMEYAQAHILSALMLVFAVIVLTVVYGLYRQGSREHAA